MKTAIVAMLLATAITSQADAACYFDPGTGKCNPAAFHVVPFRDLTKQSPSYESRSQTVIKSSFGTSVINSRYRSYSR